jgi:WD40-like Beta Propeller Repeat
MVHNLDQTPLDAILAPGKPVTLLGNTLSGGSAPHAAAAGNGWLAIVNASRSELGRVIWQGKRVEARHPGLGRCAAVASPPSAVTLDPAWSPDGLRLAYVQAPYRASAAFPPKVVAAWYAAHQLWLYDPASGARRELDAMGASVPIWSANGKSLLYAARDAIWLLPRLDGHPVRVVGPLFPPGYRPSYYGQVDWIGQFAWWPGGGH